MISRNKIIKMGRDLIDTGENFVIASIVDAKGSTPRKKGAILLMRKDKSCYGTVGGGLIEAEVEKLCIKAFDIRQSGLHRFHLSPEDQAGLDMRCGGDVTVDIKYMDASNPEAFNFEEDVNSIVYIFGAGHVGLAIEPVARHVGFQTVILDDRPEFANKERFPMADQILVKDFEHAFLDLNIDKNSFIVIVTRGHSKDYEVLKQALTTEAAYIGMIGSKIKVAEIFQKLREDGFTEQDLNRVYSPIGLKIHAETPEEIAVSIVAEMIKVRAENE